jgi:hypothetical protein
MDKETTGPSAASVWCLRRFYGPTELRNNKARIHTKSNSEPIQI